MKKSPAQDPEKPNSHPLRAVHWLEKTGMDGQVDGPAPDNADEEDDEAEDGIQHAGWASLFLFTRKSHTLTLLTAVVLSVVSGVIIPATSVFLGIIFNSFTDFGAGQITGPELTAKISVQCIALVALGGASWALNGGYFGCWLAFGELQAKTARESVFDEMIGKDMEWFDMQRDGMGGLIPQLQSLTRQLQIATSQPLGFVVQYSVTALAAVGVAFYNSWNLTLVTLATVPIAALILSFISARMQPHIEAQEAGLSNATKFACSAITSITTVKCFTGEAHEIRRFGDAIQTAARSYLKQAHANAMQIGIVRLSILSMFVQGFWYGSTLVGPGGKSAGQILTTFWSALMATQTIEQILPQMIVLEKGRVAGATLTSIISRTAGIRRENERRGGVAPGPCRGGVDLKEISFAYPSSPQQPAIHNASLFFPAGETTFVVGRSGSGKSTIGNLLLRYYSHNEGQIFIDGHPIQTLDLSWLREQITLVQQQTVLFTESLRHNILFGCQDGRVVTDAEVRQACQLALLQHMVNDLPDGLDTPVGMGGDALSGGQKQRVAIARARLRDTPILILDESTSALDYISRSLVMDAIREWRRGKTTIIITHDISQIFEDDYVYVMDAGQVVQEGYRGHLETDADGVFASFAPVASTAPSPVTEDEIQPVTLATSTSLSAEPISRVLEDYATFRASHYSRLSTTGLPRLPAASYRRFSLEPALPDTPLSPPWSPSEDLELVRLARKNSAKIRQSPGSTPLGASSSPATPSSSKPLQRPDSFRNRTRHVLGKSTTGPRRMRSLSSILATVWQVLDGKHRAILILGFVCAFLHAGATPTFSYLFANLLSTFFAGPDDQKQLAIKWSLSVLGVSIGDGLSSYSMHYLLEYSGQAWVDGLRIQAYTRVLQQSQAWFDEEDPSASRIVECLDRNAEEMRNLVGRFVGSAFVAACMTSMAIIWSFAICWKLTIVGLASAPAMYAITRAFETVSGRWESRSNDAAEEAASVFAEVFTTIRVVKALTLEGYFRKKYLAAAEESLRVGLRRAAYSGVFFGLSDSGILFIMGTSPFLHHQLEALSGP
ncbi:MAG: hypothetical protein M1838_001849 [Thelocarpon superellum]|nr:MAG: hypothetical protein M1838_001849 [Thelocarpon superellum]